MFWRRWLPARNSARRTTAKPRPRSSTGPRNSPGTGPTSAGPGSSADPGDGSDRYGYWPARFARDADPVLVPDIPADATQIIDVRDLAAWILTAAENGTTGALNAVGEPVPFAAYLEESRQLADADAEVVVAPEDWLASHGANYWAGPDSLPLWLPPGHEGFATRSNAAARAAGLRIRPWMDTLRDTLADERRRGLGRERKAGMSPETERRILAEYQAAHRGLGRARPTARLSPQSCSARLALDHSRSARAAPES